MIERVVIGRGAARDIAEARDWYDAQQPGIGKAFLDEIESALNRVSIGPDRYPIIVRDARRALIRRFPYAIYFRVRERTLRVLAVVHQHRDPRVWRRRIGG